jgi:hypothetical protein
MQVGDIPLHYHSGAVMSALPVASSTNSSSLQGLYQQSKSAFKTLAKDVQSGDMSGAQSALTALQQAAGGIQGLGGSSGTQQSSPLQNAFASLISSIQAGGQSGPQNLVSALQSAQSTQTTAGTSGAGASTSATGTAQTSLGQDLAALIQAVQSGSLSSAQQDLTQLQSDAKSQISGHHHHHHGGAGASDAVAGTSATGASSSGNTGASASAYAAMTGVQAPTSSMTAQA